MIHRRGAETQRKTDSLKLFSVLSVSLWFKTKPDLTTETQRAPRKSFRRAASVRERWRRLRQRLYPPLPYGRGSVSAIGVAARRLGAPRRGFRQAIAREVLLVAAMGCVLGSAMSLWIGRAL